MRKVLIVIAAQLLQLILLAIAIDLVRMIFAHLCVAPPRRDRRMSILEFFTVHRELPSPKAPY